MRKSIPVFEVLEAGLLTTVQDLGRFGYQKYGVPVSGAMDLFSFKVANLLVGNTEGEAALEITGLGSVKLKVLTAAAVALTGADLTAMIDGSPVAMWRAIKVEKDEILSLGRPRKGFRAYLSVAGGIDVPVVLGSRSTYFRAKIGGVEGRPLKKGDIISSFLPEKLPGAILRRYLPPDFIPDLTGQVEARVIMGPQDDYFTEEGIRIFLNSWYEILPESDRTGYRLTGPRIAHKDKQDIITDAIPLGAIQVPGDGLPIILMADRGVTGGYPKIACVAGVDISKIAQLKPKDKIKFKKIDVREAHRLLKAESEKLSRIAEILDGQSRKPFKKRYKVSMEGETYEVTVEELPEQKERDKIPWMKRRFAVGVNNVSYEVVVEEAGEDLSEDKTSLPVLEAAPPAAEEEVIFAPFPAKVLSIKVKRGDMVKKGQILLTLEAMKMETEISAPRDGKVREIFVKEGEMVDTDSRLLTVG